ncbi:MAG TPA: YgaP-like transmembrane domain [Beijerinckiaceae bacterium]|jgi:uncharacterized membrane protein
MAGDSTDLYHQAFGGETNLSWTERGISLALGLGLAAAGAQPRPNPLLNVLAIAGGAYLALRGASGHCPIKAALQGGEGSDRIASGMGPSGRGTGERARVQASVH